MTNPGNVQPAELEVTDRVCVTEEEVAKNHQFKPAPEEIDLIDQRVKESLALVDIQRFVVGDKSGWLG